MVIKITVHTENQDIMHKIKIMLEERYGYAECHDCGIFFPVEDVQVLRYLQDICACACRKCFTLRKKEGRPI